MEATVGCDGVVRLAGAQWRCALGRGGVRVNKREGDGTTPAGRLILRRVLYRADRVAAPATVVPVEPIAPDDGWCDDPHDLHYNCAIRLPYPGRHERLWRSDQVYDVVGVLGWNDAPVVPERGSAIFLHIARLDYAPTLGCIALAAADLRALLAAGLSALRVLPPG